MKTVPVIAYYSGWGMIYIHAIEYGIDDRVQWSVGTDPKIHSAMIYYTKKLGDAYFYANAHRIPLHECIRASYPDMSKEVER
jgi:hypothetical protein